MPDITKCTNSKCPLREHCYRYRASPDSMWQSYSYFEPKDVECEYFWDIAFAETPILPTKKIDDGLNFNIEGLNNEKHK